MDSKKTGREKKYTSDKKNNRIRTKKKKTYEVTPIKLEKGGS